MRTGNKRYICSFLKRDSKGEIKPNVVVISSANDIIARMKLCQKYSIPITILTNNETYNKNREGIKKIRLSETNKYEGELEGDNFSQCL